MYPVYREPRPIPASSASRSKLKAFRYQNDDENGTEVSPAKADPPKALANKENQTSWLNGVVEQSKPTSVPEQLPQEILETKAAKDCPQTPGNRLPLADLIGNAEDAFSRAPVGQDFTPEDYVIWQHVPPSSNPSTQTPATQSKKRRHSSSPNSSPLAGSRGAQKGTFDLQAFQNVLKTPQNDLAADLWNNYVAKTTTNVTDLQQPRFTNLLSSSPRTPRTAISGPDSSGLRRSNSCNAEWPSSKAKRRKIEAESHPTGRAIFSRTRSNILVPKDFKASNFSSLVKEMERSLNRAPPKQPDRPKVAASISMKARQERLTSPLEAKPAKPADGTDGLLGCPCPSPNKKTLQESFSDFGDDDLDDDFLELAEASMDPFIETTQLDKASRKPDMEHGHDLPLNKSGPSFNNTNHELPLGANQVIPPKNDDIALDDEFDDDFEGFSDNIDEILAGCDETPSNRTSRSIQESQRLERPIPHKNREGQPATPGTSHGEANEQCITSSDEFGDDDFDLDCFDQPTSQTEVAKLSSDT
ncbi:hypothetical protein BJX63DRAFT_316605 [Aspergillus granulosus]|uniref:Uncharacterized protein n=1 Tax=Aspergillus granulosus TaxID=176169 RepID=A0ABR4H4T7_9EURO